MKAPFQWFVTTCLFALVESSAMATIQEVEPNDSIAQSQLIPVKPSCFAEAVDGTLAPGDVDFYQIELAKHAIFIANLFDFTPLVADNDSILALFDADGTMIAFDNDGGPDVLSVLFLIVPHSGTYYIGVSGFGDTTFVGDHDQLFPYKLVVNSCIPAPGALPLLGAFGLRVSRRRSA